MAEVTTLLAPAIGGDQRAQNELYRLVEPELRKLAWHWVFRYSAQERVRVSDAIERVFMKLMKVKSPGWKHRGQFYSFACRNMPCVLIDLLRSQDRGRKVGIENDNENSAFEPSAKKPNGLTEASLISLRQALEDLEKALSHTHREVIELKYFGELNLNEIEEITGIDRSSVHRMLQVAYRYLQVELRSSFPDFGRFSNEEEASA